MKVRSLKSLSLLAAIAAVAFSSAVADHDEVIAGPLATFGAAGTAGNATGTFTVAGTPLLNQIAVDATIEGVITGTFYNDVAVRLTSPGGQVYDIQINPTGAAFGLPPRRGISVAGSGFTLPGPVDANGIWSYQFFETFDEGGTAGQDSSVTNVTFRFQGPIAGALPTLYSETFDLYSTTTSTDPRQGTWKDSPTGLGETNNTNGWMEARSNTATLPVGAIAFTGATAVPRSRNGYGSWLADGLGNVGTTGALRCAVSGTTIREFIISPLVAIPASGSFQVKYDYSVNGSNVTTAGTFGADDNVRFMVSDDGGVTWTNGPATTLATYDAANGPHPNVSTLATHVLPGAFNGQNVRFAFYAESSVTGGTVDFSFDNFRVEEVPTGPAFSSSSLAGVPANQFGRRLVTYTATVLNDGASPSTNTTLSVPIQAGFTYVPASAMLTTSVPFATGALDDTGGNISVGATAVPNGESFTVTWSYESTATTGTATTTATINDASLGTPLDRTFVHTFRPDLPVAAGSDIFYETYDSTQVSPNAPVFAYETPSGTPIVFASDDATVDLTTSSTPALPSWPIFLYGNQINTLTVDHDGVLVANTPAANPGFTNSDLSTGTTTDNFIAALWDDADDTPSSVRAFETGVAPNRKFIIDWLSNDFGTTNPWQFQAIFSEANQDVVFQYLDVTSGASDDAGRGATVGIRGSGTAQARQYVFNSGTGAPPLLANLAIRYRFLDPTIGSVAAGQSVPAPGVATLVPVTLNSSEVPGVGTPFIIDVVSSGGTAVAGTDYDAVSTQATISNPANSTTFNVNLLPRATRGGNATVGFTLTQGAGSAPIQFAPVQPFLTIQNSIALPMNRAYGADFFGGASNEFYDIDPVAPTTGATVLNAANGLNPGALWGYGDFGNNNFTNFRFQRGNQLFTSNTTTFAETAGAPLTGGPALTDVVRGLKFDRTTGNWYIVWVDTTLISPASLGTVDMATGVVTPIGATGAVGSPLNGIIIDPVSGALFGFDTNNATDRLISIDKGTGVGSVVGPFGTNLANFSGDGDFDDAAGIAYYSGTDNGGSGFNKWYTVNTTTGALTEIANLETALGLGQMSALGITTISTAGVADWTMH